MVRKASALEDDLRSYLESISRYPLLSREEEIAFGEKARRGDQEAVRILVERNLRLVIPVAKAYLNRGLSFLDLIEEGNTGLMRAAAKYDPHIARFSTYSHHWIKVRIQRAILKNRRQAGLAALENIGEPGMRENNCAAYDLQDELMSLVRSLPTRERKIIEARYFGHTIPCLSVVGEEFGCSKEWIRQIEEKALNRLRHLAESRGLKPYNDRNGKENHA